MKLAALAPARWIRLLYTHPAHYTDDLIAVVRDEPAVCKYLDIPLQHINNRILKAMNRGINKAAIIKLITRLRKEIPALTIRTTFLVGFPGETDEEFNELLQFISEMKFERLGIFSYSREEGTPAHGLKGQVPEKVKKERFDLLMRRQQEIARAVNARELGREVEVLIDEPSENKQLPGQPREFIGRTAADAPEVDGTCFVTSRKDHVSGDFIKVKITDTLEYDLVGEEIA